MAVFGAGQYSVRIKRRKASLSFLRQQCQTVNISRVHILSSSVLDDTTAQRLIKNIYKKKKKDTQIYFESLMHAALGSHLAAQDSANQMLFL